MMKSLLRCLGRRGDLSVRPRRRARRLAPAYEPLDTRQLLSISVFPAPTNAMEAASSDVTVPSVDLAPLATSSSPTGLTPEQITTAYGVNEISFDGKVVGDGAGQTIAIVDAFFDPNIQSDLATFDKEFGLAAPPSFTQFVESGLREENSSWALETALDVEWAHAIAPDAKIDLIEAFPDLDDLLSGVSFAASQSGVSVVSMSWGSSEFAGETALDSVFTTSAGHNGITFVASAGDTAIVEYPSASPNVLAVGGTTLNLNSNGTIASETAWSDSGGGLSAFEPGQAFQTAALKASGLQTTARATPDVAFDANPSTGVAVFDSVGGLGWVQVGGTSVGAPSWAGLIAIADQGLALAGKSSLANAQQDLYQLPSSDFNDVTSGSTPFHSAGPGVDLVTGLGSPKANLLIPALVAANGGNSVVTPATTAHPAATTAHHSGSTAAMPSAVSITTTPSPAAPSDSTSPNNSSITALESSTTSITPLNPSVLASASTQVPIIGTAIPPAPSANSGQAVAPVTTQATLAVVAHEQRPVTPSDQGPNAAIELDVRGLEVQVAVPSNDALPIDVAEPLQPAAPEVEGQPALPPSAAPPRSLPASAASDFETLVDLSVADLFPEALESSSPSGDQPEEIRSSWDLSTVFGAAIVAAGGYHLAVRRPYRFPGRGIQARTEGDRSARRPFGGPIR